MNHSVLKRFATILILCLTAGCAYHFGFSERGLPGGYDKVAIPIFKNKTDQVGIEADFTNALIQNFESSRVARIIDKKTAPIRIEGNITSVEITHSPGTLGGSNSGIPHLPDGVVLATEYRMVVQAKMRIVRQSDEKVIWQGNFQNEKAFSGARVGEPVVNSANALYNQSIRKQKLAELAQDMMAEAFERMTENF